MRKIEQFLPPRFRTKTIRNFMNSTTNQLFSKKVATTDSYYVGRTPSGLYNPTNDYYAPEVRKVRSDYQLEPTHIIRHPNSNDIKKALFYEDMINVLADNGSDIESHSRALSSQCYSLSFPIDVDMFINYRDYYWYPDGIDGVTVNTTVAEINGNISSTVPTHDNIPVQLSNGMFINIENKQYIVTGVGRSIALVEFEYNKTHITKHYNQNPSATVLEKHPKDYITIDRNSKDMNAWSMSNMWFHKDAISFRYGEQRFRPNNARRAKRPIICFNSDIDIYNYNNKFITFYDEYVTLGNTRSIVDGVVINQNNNRIETIENNIITKFVKMTDGRYTSRKTHLEMNYNSGVYTTAQSKLTNTQAPIFNLYDTSGVSIDNDLKYPNSTFVGSKIISYLVDDEYGVYDSELGLEVMFKAGNEQSEIQYKNHIIDIDISSIDGGEVYYKINRTVIPNQHLRFGINIDYNGDRTIIVNGEVLPNIVVFADSPYITDIDDINTTTRGWFGIHIPIRIYDDSGENLVGDTTASSIVTQRTVSFDAGKKYFYTDGTMVGNIFVVERDVDAVSFNSLWKANGSHPITLLQKEHIENPNNPIGIKYIPNSKLIITHNNSQIAPDKITQEQNNVFINGLSKGDYIEIRYTSNDINISSDDIVQEIFPSWINNPFNDDIDSFTFSEIFPHFISVIGNQTNLKGTPLSSNNYRDVLREIELGNVIVKHSAPAPLLAFIASNDEFSPINAILYAAAQYEAYKRGIITGTEIVMKSTDVTTSNARNILDKVITNNNSNKVPSDAFADAYMLAVYSKYSNIRLDNFVTNTFIDVDNIKNALYLYTDSGLMVNGIDFIIHSDYNAMYTYLELLTFTQEDIVEIRYYQNIESSFCPPTPSKFGLSKPFLPKLLVIDTYANDTMILRGHDGSEVLAYTSIEDYNSGNTDARDLVMLEFETRIYNGILDQFKRTGNPIVDKTTNRNGYFRNKKVSSIEELEFQYFNKWCTDNSINYRENDSYVDGDQFTYNYPTIVDTAHSHYGGSWKSIFMYFYDTYTPHTMPWEMLGFEIKPLWWDVVYGNDYGSTNAKLWKDLEQGIIRNGSRENLSNNSYLSKDNLYRRIGLSNYIPVDRFGHLLSPIDIGIYNITTINHTDIGGIPWNFGDYSPVETAWRNTSTYKYISQIVMYIMSPLDYVSKSWNTTHESTRILDTESLIPHSSDGYVAGLSQWIHNYLVFVHEDTNELLYNGFNNQDMILGHKVGGFIDTDSLQIHTESYNPSAISSTTLIPTEDISVMLYSSKELSRIPYSGVIIERTKSGSTTLPFTNGVVYKNGDVVFNVDTTHYYRYSNTVEHTEWLNSTFYNEGRHITYEGVAYTCISSHRAVGDQLPNMTNSVFWTKKGFVEQEWSYLSIPPKHESSYFRVYGYDQYSPKFNIIKGNPKGSSQLLSTLTRNSKEVRQQLWKEGNDYSSGNMFVLPNNRSIIMTVSGISGVIPTEGTYKYLDNDVRFTNMLNQEVLIEPLIIDGHVQYDSIEYGHIFKNVGEVCNFLMGYSRYLESTGWVFDNIDVRREKQNDWFLMSTDFMQWTSETSEQGSLIILSPAADSVKFKAPYGVPSVRRSQNPDRVTLLDQRFGIIDDYEVLRLDNKFTLSTRDTPIYYCSVGINEVEHAIFINNVSMFNDVNYDKVFGIRKDRLKLTVVKTGNWDGTMTADGFIISDGKLLPNFDTTADEMRHNADMEYISSNDVYNKLKFHNIGFQQRDYLRELGIDTLAQVAFYKGFIQEKGTKAVIDKFTRLGNLGNNFDLEVYEEWAFKRAEYGGVSNSQMIELLLEQGSIVNIPQPIILEYNQKHVEQLSSNIYFDITDTDRWLSKPSDMFQSNSVFKLKDTNGITNAGFVLWDDSEIKSFDLASVNTAIIQSNITPTFITPLDITSKHNKPGTRIHFATTILNNSEWDIVQYEKSNISIDEIVTHGVNGKCSFVFHASNVDTNALYGIYSNGVVLTFRFVLIENGYYIGKSVDGNTLVLPDTLLPNEIVIGKWASLRKNVAANTSNQATTNGITLYDGLRLFMGNEHNDWYVTEYNNGTWTRVYEKELVVDSSVIDRIVLYSNATKDTLRELRMYDPLQGLYPTDILKKINWIIDYDPANYDSGQGYTAWGDEMVGKLWWDTSRLIYMNYYIGGSDYSKQYWGQLFPTSNISIMEWTRDVKPPNADTLYTTNKVYEKDIGVTLTYYYFWSNSSVESIDGNMTPREIMQNIHNSHRNNGYMSIISKDMIILNEVTNIKQEDLVLQINYRITNSSIPKHTEWSIVGESKRNTKIPTELHNSMLDSVIGYNKENIKLPFDNLSTPSRLGINEGQSWFVNRNTAMQVFVERLNSFLKNINWWDINQYRENVGTIDLYSDYFGIEDWYKIKIDRDTVIPYSTNDRNKMRLLPMLHNQLVLVEDEKGNRPTTTGVNWSIFRYDSINDLYEKVAEKNACLQFTNKLYKADYTSEDSISIRNTINVVYGILTSFKEYSNEINDVFFSLVRYVLSEQPNVDWVFPTSYISAYQYSGELVQKTLFQRDKDDQIIDFIREAKPYHTKLRKYDKILGAPKEVVGLYVTDFDKNPYITKTERDIISLQESKIEKLKGDNITTLFETKELHSPTNIKVFVNGRLLPSDSYSIPSIRKIVFKNAPAEGINAIKNIVIVSENTNHLPIMTDYRDIRGYMGVKDSALRDWLVTVNQKHVKVKYDRVSNYTKHMTLEDVKRLYDNSRMNDLPLAAFTQLSYVDTIDRFTQFERTMVSNYYELLSDVIAHSSNSLYSNKISKDNVLLQLDNIIISSDLYTVVNKNNGIEVVMLHNITGNGTTIHIRPRDKTMELFDAINNANAIDGVLKFANIVVPEIIDLGAVLDDVTYNIVTSDIGDDVTTAKLGTNFNESSDRGLPEELSSLVIKEAIVTTYMNNFATKGSRDIGIVNEFATIDFKYKNNMNGKHSAVLNVDPRQVLVIVDNDEWILNTHYKLYDGIIEFVKIPRNNANVLLVDRLSGGNHYGIEDVGGIDISGYNSLIQIPDFLNTKESIREFTVYFNGLVHQFSSIGSSGIIGSIDMDSSEIELDTMIPNMIFPNDGKRLVALYAERSVVDTVTGKLTKLESAVEFVFINSYTNNRVGIVDRGVINGSARIFDSTKYTKIELHNLDVGRELSAMLIVEPYIGNPRSSYPKYGHIISGNE